ncbi:hypothetical protein D9M70_608130 [compost metagenome]
MFFSALLVIGMWQVHKQLSALTITPRTPGYIDEAPKLNGQPCHQDCPESLQGYEWALLRDLRHGKECSRYTGAFAQGCQMRVQVQMDIRSRK